MNLITWELGLSEVKEIWRNAVQLITFRARLQSVTSNSTSIVFCILPHCLKSPEGILQSDKGIRHIYIYKTIRVTKVKSSVIHVLQLRSSLEGQQGEKSQARGYGHLY